MKEDHPPCPECRGKAEIDWDIQGLPAVPAHDLHGGRMKSQEFQCAPHEVAEVRQLFGKGAAHCINDDGSASFTHRAEARRFFEREHQLEREFAQKKIEREAKGLPPKKRRPNPRLLAQGINPAKIIKKGQPQ